MQQRIRARMRRIYTSERTFVRETVRKSLKRAIPLSTVTSHTLGKRERERKEKQPSGKKEKELKKKKEKEKKVDLQFEIENFQVKCTRSNSTSSLRDICR